MNREPFNLRRSHRRLSLLVPLVTMPIVLLLLSVSAGMGGTRMESTGLGSPPATANASEPCLRDDPYNLEGLREVLDATLPPTRTQTINQYMTVKFTGKGELVRGRPTAPVLELTDPPNDGEDEPPAREADYAEVQLRVFNAVTENEFHLIAQQAMLDDILHCHQEAGLTRATKGVDHPAPEDRPSYLPIVSGDGPAAAHSADAPTPDGWSNGVDTRIIRSPTTLWPWPTISQFTYISGPDNSGCSGTLIGPRHLVTAAHCINAQGTNQWFTVRVAPGKNGVDNEPYGSSTISLNPPPGTSAWYFTPWQWRDPGLTHWQWDWGAIVIPDSLGNLTGWMGYVAMNGNYLNTVANYNRGYARCGPVNDPSNCQLSRLYGDTHYFGIGNFYNPGPDGWNRRISVSCDMSLGHSGSAVYNYFWDANLGQYWPVVAMMASTQSCQTCGPSDDFPNIMRRITPGDLSTISWLRETFP